MGFVDNFTKPPHHPSLRRGQRSCSSGMSWQSYATSPARIGGPLKVHNKEPSLDICWEGGESQRARPQRQAPTGSLQRAIDKTVEYDLSKPATMTPRIKPMSREKSLQFKDSPLRTLARDISWSNMDSLFATASDDDEIKAAVSPRKKTSPTPPPPPFETIEIPIGKRRDSKKNPSVSKKEGHSKTPGQTLADALSLHDLAFPGLSRTDRMVETKSKRTERARKKFDLTSCLDEALAISDPDAFQKERRPLKTPTVPKSTSSTDDESTACESAAMDKSVHSSMSYIRMRAARSPFKSSRKVNHLRQSPLHRLCVPPPFLTNESVFDPTATGKIQLVNPLRSSQQTTLRYPDNSKPKNTKEVEHAVSCNKVFADIPLGKRDEVFA
jgi:hypothetical protein